MNFVAHVLVADRLTTAGGPSILVGAAAPDLVRMAGVPLAVDLAPAPAAGVALHHRTDAAFHDLAWFRGTTRALSAELVDRGVRRSPARGAAHVLVELLLDGALLVGGHDTGGFRTAWSSLAAQDDHARAVVAGEHQAAWLGFLDLLTTRLEPERYADPDYAAQRVTGTLARRPRLALTVTEAATVAAAADATAATVAVSAPSVLAGVTSALRPDDGQTSPP